MEDTNQAQGARKLNEAASGIDNTSLLRIGVIFLALVSFFTTANGMKQYIFKDENSGVAYAASAAIQCILLALSMNLPRYLRGLWNIGRKEKAGTRAEDESGSKWRRFGVWLWKKVRLLVADVLRLLLCAVLLLLSGVTLFCSSWFSYVFIANVIHQDSWGTDSELLVQQTYRRELYGAQDYARAYRTYLEESVGEDILLLEQQAKGIEDANPNEEVDWQVERDTYASGDGTAASYMSPVIDAMKAAMGEDSSEERRDLAATAIRNANQNILDRQAAVQETLDRININLSNYSAQMADVTRRIDNAAPGTDITSLTNSMNRLTQLTNQTIEQQIGLQQESALLDSARSRLAYYESVLGLSNATSSIAIRGALIEMQSEFFKSDPDDQALLDTAITIFDNLRSAANAAENRTDSDAFSYTNLLIQMNRLIQNLTDYSEIKDIEANLNELIAELRTISIGEPDGSETQASASPAQEGEASPAASGVPPQESEAPPAASGVPPEEGEASPAVSGAPPEAGGQPTAAAGGGASTQSASPQNQEQEQETEKDDAWKKDWRVRLENLKAQISAMPVYSEAAQEAEAAQTPAQTQTPAAPTPTPAENVKVMNESQLNLLRSYDRAASSAALDEMIRRYIAERNAIDMGIIYLQSPYWTLAVFALCLAFAFDISGFVFGLVMQGQPEPKKDARGEKEDEEEEKPAGRVSVLANRVMDKRGRTKWTVLECLYKYRIFTGEFRHRNDTYFYKVFRDGVQEEWTVSDRLCPTSYGVGIYRLVDGTVGQGDDQERGEIGELVGGPEDDEQELRFLGQGEGQKLEPQDGIYKNCTLIYHKGGLFKEKSDTYTYLCSVEEYVPVHCYDPHEGERRTFPVKALARKMPITVKTAVVALNESATRVAAIYMIRDR